MELYSLLAIEVEDCQDFGLAGVQKSETQKMDFRDTAQSATVVSVWVLCSASGRTTSRGPNGSSRF
jgi:hypothetical protein